MEFGQDEVMKTAASFPFWEGAILTPLICITIELPNFACRGPHSSHPMPSLPSSLFPRASISSGAAQTASELKSQWTNPSNIASILLILAGDIVGQALQNLSGPSIVPVVFSFGWVSHAHQAFVSAVGLHQLLKPDNAGGQGWLVDVGTGKGKPNDSVLLQQVLSDWSSWKPRDVSDDEAHDRSVERGEKAPDREEMSGVDASDDSDDEDPFDPLEHQLRIVVFGVTRSLGSPTTDYLWWMGITCALIQLGIAAIPCGLHGRWGVLLVTGAGTILAFTTGALPQFGKEKWGDKAKRNGNRTIALARGHLKDATEIIVIRGITDNIAAPSLLQGTGNDINANVLYKNYNSTPCAWAWTRLTTAILAACWIILLIIVSGLRYDSWYLLGVGFLGMIQNGYVAASPRTPAARGLHMVYQSLVKSQMAANAIVEAEKEYAPVGRALLRNMCPDASQEQRSAWWVRRGFASKRNSQKNTESRHR